MNAWKEYALRLRALGAYRAFLDLPPVQALQQLVEELAKDAPEGGALVSSPCRSNKVFADPYQPSVSLCVMCAQHTASLLLSYHIFAPKGNTARPRYAKCCL